MSFLHFGTMKFPEVEEIDLGQHVAAPYHYADNPRFSLSEKKMSIRHNLRTSTSASSSRA